MSDKPDVLQLIPFRPEVQPELEARFTVHKAYDPATRLEVAAGVADRVQAIATGGEHPLGADVMDALPGLKVIASFGVGYDAIDVAAATARGVTVTNTPGVLSKEVADFAMAIMLAQVRRLAHGEQHVRSRAWKDGPAPFTPRFYGRKVGILGMGGIGKEIARRCVPFDMEIAYCARSAKTDLPYRFEPDLANLAAWADFLIAILPGGPATEGIVSRQVLEALGPQGVFVNVARGSVVDQDALIDLLSSGGLGGAALDVMVNEPDPDPRLFDLPNTVLQPHNASATFETRTAMGMLVVDNLSSWFAGKGAITPVS